jgi:hypothetical protein
MDQAKIDKMVGAWAAYMNYALASEREGFLLDYACKIDATAREFREAKKQIAASQPAGDGEAAAE